jgi:methylenetetrahydrofolate--tRNA-(uracil-5-)-methyltransferase
MQTVSIIGGGMAGSEAALQLARRGVRVRLHEMRPVRQTEAHHTDGFAELVCSNSFRGDALANAVGLLKEEMRRAGGALIRIAEDARVPAGGALAVDRDVFSELVGAAIAAEPNIEVVRGEVTELPPGDGPCLVATGPLTSSALAENIRSLTGESQLYFYDAIAPIIDADSIDRDVVFEASRYGKGGGADYLNCPMTEEEYVAFIAAMNAAELAPVKAFEETKFFEACLPIEVLASRGLDTPRFGPMKPVGLVDPRTGEQPWAVIQLRTENLDRTAYNMVGFQSRMKWGEQGRVFRMIPGLEQAEFLRYGSVHRNTFIHGPHLLDGTLRLKADPRIRFGGQITGVEGYVESMACGLIAAWAIASELTGAEPVPPPAETALGGLVRHVTGERAFDTDTFQPSNVNWSMLPPLEGRKIRRRRARRLGLAERALDTLEGWLAKLPDSIGRLEGFTRHEPGDEDA